jgi:NTP pyrophosphatase (non-canonical NTP hydrolase)
MENFDKIREWAGAKGIYENGDPKTQYIKLQEEAGELAKAILKNDKGEIIDGLGDCVIVLVSLSHLLGLKLEDCINIAYLEIKNRKGKMVNGTFIKNN